MSYSAERSVALLCHPTSRSGPVRGMAARVRRSRDGALAVVFTIEGDIARVRVPAPRLPRFADRLWEHTCCEVFVALERGAAYHEFNLAPSGEWAAYAFRRYREREGPDATGLDPHIVFRRSAGALELEATIRLDLVSAGLARARLALGLSAVIEGADGSLSYWALAHPPGRPDFHHTDAFALELDEIRD
jgi:hypothetical protein